MTDVNRCVDCGTPSIRERCLECFKKFRRRKRMIRDRSRIERTTGAPQDFYDAWREYTREDE